MKIQEEIINNSKVHVFMCGVDGGAGSIYLPHKNKQLNVIWSFGGGWDHVSVSLPNRCPTWEEMCAVKDIFFNADETVIQYHPKKSEYVNLHPYVLHMWKKQGTDFELPPKYMV